MSTSRRSSGPRPRPASTTSGRRRRRRSSTASAPASSSSPSRPAGGRPPGLSRDALRPRPDDRPGRDGPVPGPGLRPRPARRDAAAGPRPPARRAGRRLTRRLRRTPYCRATRPRTTLPLSGARAHRRGADRELARALGAIRSPITCIADPRRRSEPGRLAAGRCADAAPSDRAPGTARQRPRRPPARGGRTGPPARMARVASAPRAAARTGWTDSRGAPSRVRSTRQPNRRDRRRDQHLVHRGVPGRRASRSSS